MAMKVKNNLGAVRTLNTLNKNSQAVQKNLRKVATGERINSAADDASGYGISERMREKIRSLEQSNQNTQNDLAMMRTAEGAVANIVDLLRTLKQKAIDSANDSNTDDDRRIMQKEVDQLIDQIDDNALVTFNGKFLVNGAMNGATSNTRYAFYNENILFDGDSFDTPSKANGNVLASPAFFDLRDFRYSDTGELLGIELGDTWELVVMYSNGEKRITTGTLNRNHYTLFDILGTQSILSLALTGDRYPALVASANTPTGDGIVTAFFDGETPPAVADKHGQPLQIPNPDLSTLVLYSQKYNNSNGGFGEVQATRFKITIMDESGNVKESPTEALNYKLLQRGSNASGNGGWYIKCRNLPRRRGRESINDNELERHARFGSRSQK